MEYRYSILVSNHIMIFMLWEGSIEESRLGVKQIGHSGLDEQERILK